MSPPSGQHPWAVLRQFARPKAPVERCELCGMALAVEHPHLLELSGRRLVCSCDACAILFSGRESTRFRRVRQHIQSLTDFRLEDAQWDGLLIPINMAFFSPNSAASRVVAYYPSPAGAMESLLPLETWQALVEANPVLRELEPDVEALLVNRVGDARDYFRVSIDECYKLVGLIRAGWRGLSGGTEVWTEIGRFFGRLKEHARA